MAISTSAIETAINALVASPQVDYTVGDKTFAKGDLIRQLIALRESLAKTPEVELELVTFDGDISLSGFDFTQTAVP